MTRTLEEVIAEIKSRLNIVDVVSEQVILKKNGGRYWGLCPFHNENTPSFSVNPQLGIYKCFGCGAGGDALSFIMKTKNIEFMDLIKDLAQQFDIEMPAHFQKQNISKDLKNDMMTACEKAAVFYHDLLINHHSDEIKAANDYLLLKEVDPLVVQASHGNLRRPSSYSKERQWLLSLYKKFGYRAIECYYHTRDVVLAPARAVRTGIHWIIRK